MLDSADDDRIDKVLKMRQSLVEKYGNAPEVIVVEPHRNQVQVNYNSRLTHTCSRRSQEC